MISEKYENMLSLNIVCELSMVTIYSMVNNHYVNKLKTDVFWSIRLLCELFQIKHYAVLFVYFSVYAHSVNSCSFMRTFASNKLRLSQST